MDGDRDGLSDGTAVHGEHGRDDERSHLRERRVIVQSAPGSRRACGLTACSEAERWRPASAATRDDAGLLMYMHSVSTPGWAFAIWLSLFVGFVGLRDGEKPVRISWVLWRQLLSGLAFLAVAAPFALVYLNNHQHGTEGNYREVFNIVSRHLGLKFFHVRDATAAFIREDFLTMPWLIRYGPLALLPLFFFPAQRRRAVTLAVWFVGLVLVAVALPAIDQHWARANGRMPVEVDLVRGLRYLIPVSVAAAMLLLASPTTSQLAPNKRYPLIAACLLIFGVLFVDEMGRTRSFDPVKSFIAHRGFNVSALDKERILLAEAVARTPKSALILPSASANSSGGDFLETRYFGRRAVLHTWKDGNILSYANHDRLKKWAHIKWQLGKANAKENSVPQRLTQLVSIARQHGADHLIVNARIRDGDLTGLPLTKLYAGQKFALLRIDPAVVDPAVVE